MTDREARAGALLRGRVALITGSSRNLGAEIARGAAARGARVVVTYRSCAACAEEVTASLAGDGHVVVGGDVSTPEGAEKIVREAERLTGAVIDVLVNNAGPFSMKPFTTLPPGEFDYVWNANVRSAYLMSRLLAPRMTASGWGRIVNLSAGSAFGRNHSVYTLAKNAVITLTQELALELGPEITVNAVAPGQIAESVDEITAFDKDFVARTIARTPAGRLVTRAEVADVVLALCSPDFDMVTGTVIEIDGGARLPVT